ncbi:GntR family transcriptional regulator [Desertihabitans aurantiacus]|uniref:GntR family transcriptional regulator n=1 Tax=Desertihabitans aurantiacus TaxID=2282477 RepID=UPI0018E5774E|nr:GntR family transcriptional regulator [Desertihabitans aurantiacus]
MVTTTSQFKLGPSSLTEAVYESLRARIINGEIAPGEKVTEQRLTSEYGVARPTAKSCLERLTALGLLRRVAHKSAVVPRLGAAEIDDLFFSRITFEQAATGHLAALHHVPDETARAQTLMEAAAQRADFTEQVQADIAFHWSLIHGLGSERLTRMYEMISGEIHLTMGQFAAHRRTTPSTVVAEHVAVMEAVRAGDVDGAKTAIADHLTRSRERVLAQLEAGDQG